MHLRTARAAVLSTIVIDQDFDLGDRVQVDRLRQPVGLADLVAEDAIDHHRVPVATFPADMWNQRAEAVAECVHAILVPHARHQPEQLGDVAGLDLDLLDLFRRDQAAVLRLGGIDVSAGGFDNDRFAKLAEFHG